MDNAPQWTANVHASYGIPITNYGTLTPEADVSYQSRVYYTEQNVAPYDAPGNEIVNLDLRYDAVSGPWGWDLYVRNATDRRWKRYAYQGVGSVVGVNYAMPRIVGLRLFWNE